MCKNGLFVNKAPIAITAPSDTVNYSGSPVTVTTGTITGYRTAISASLHNCCDRWYGECWHMQQPWNSWWCGQQYYRSSGRRITINRATKSVVAVKYDGQTCNWSNQYHVDMAWWHRQHELRDFITQPNSTSTDQVKCRYLFGDVEYNRTCKTSSGQ